MNRQQQKHDMLVTFMAHLKPVPRRKTEKARAARWRRYVAFINRHLPNIKRINKRRQCALCTYEIQTLSAYKMADVPAYA